MRKTTILAGLLTAALFAFENDAFAQGVAGGYRPTQPQRGGQPRGPRGGGRQLRKNQSPVLSPYLNQVPGITDTFTGQALMRTFPQIEAQRNAKNLQRTVDSLQDRVAEQEEIIRSGIGTTGHKTSFLNRGRYYGGGAASGAAAQ